MPIDAKSPQAKLIVPIAVVAVVASVVWIVHCIQVNQPVKMDRTPGHSQSASQVGLAPAMLARKGGVASSQ